MERMNRWLIWSLALTLGLLLGVLGYSLWDQPPTPLTRVAWSDQAEWITATQPSYRFYTRRTFTVSDQVQAAWLRLSADNDFILYVNGQPVATENSTLNNALGLAEKLSEPFQRWNDSQPYEAPSAPEILVTPTQDWRLVTYIDLAPQLRPGKNVIALEIQKNQKNARLVVEGAVYPTLSSAIDLTTGATPWQVSTIGEARQQVQWFEPDFPDYHWATAKSIGSVQAETYSRVSPRLFDRTLQGSWITGSETAQGEVWLRQLWQLPPGNHRAFIRFTGSGEYALLINNQLVKSYRVAAEQDTLHLYEVTRLLHPGSNTLAVRLARPLDQSESIFQLDPLRFFLDGWAETPTGEIVADIASNETWSNAMHPTPDPNAAAPVSQSASVLGMPNAQLLLHTYEGDAYTLNYPDQLYRQGIWLLIGVVSAIVLAWGLGFFWLQGHGQPWQHFATGTGLLLPGMLFLIGIGLLKHRYAETERGLLLFQSYGFLVILFAFLWIVLFSLLWRWIKLYQNLVINSDSTRSMQTGIWFFSGLIASGLLALLTKLQTLSALVVILLVLGVLSTIALCIYLFWIYPFRQTPLPQTSHSIVWRQFSLLWLRYSPWIRWMLVALVIGVGFGLRAYRLDAQNLDSDESTSLDATIGILRTGVPQALSKIWYTRSPAFHYLLALWLRCVGVSVVNARFFSVLWGTLTLFVIFILAKKITGRFWIAIAVTVILAIDPWCLSAARIIRFYQAVQCLTLLSFWLFLKGFVDKAGKNYQQGFFIAITLAMLNQEVTITLLPTFLIGFFCFYRPFHWSKDWLIVVGAVMSIVVVGYDIAFFGIKSMTSWVSLSTTTDSILKLHLLNVTGFLNGFFFGFNRMHTIYSFFFFLGFIYFLKQQNSKLIYLFICIFTNLIILTLLVMQIANRYAYSIYPLFIILSVYSAVCLTEFLVKSYTSFISDISEQQLPLRLIASTCCILLLVLNLEPQRLINSYSTSIVRRNTDVFEYLREHLQPGDVVISPVPPAATVTLGKLDYYMPIVARFDTVYWHEGQVIDRWGGSELITNLDQLSHVLEKAKRAWIHLDGYSLVKLDSPLAELQDYAKTLGKSEIESFGTRLNLWQQADGFLPRVPNQGKDLGAY